MKTMNTPTSTQSEPATSNPQPATEPTLGPRISESQPRPSADSVSSCLDQLSNPKSKIKNQKSDISRLPKPTRDMLNLMLDDGLPYHVIIEEVGQTAQGLNPQSLAKWVQSGYEEYLKERTMIEGVKTQAEYAADLLRELGGVDVSVVHRACMIVASLQMFKAIRKYGNDALKDMLLANPGSYLNILNTLCKMVQPTIDLENHRRAVETAPAPDRRS